jgi:hypothetical protein
MRKGELMRGLKIQDAWISKILSGEKTMEVRSVRFNVLAQRIALGNSGNGLVEGYATVQEIIEIPIHQISDYECQHLATNWLIEHYGNKEDAQKKKTGALYGYYLTNVKKENTPFPYPKSSSIWFTSVKKNEKEKC